MDPDVKKPDHDADAAGATRLEPHSPTARSAFGPGNQPPAAADSDQALPASLQGRYQLLRLLGKGGFATVYLAHDSVLDQQVAIKILKLGMTSKSDQERFLREARIGARLRHGHIAQVFDIVLSGEGLQMIMEYCPGGTLADLIKARGALKPHRAIQIARQVGQALAHAHHHQFIHRDVKPANVFFMNDGSVKLGDFGIAASVTSHEYTQTGMIIGTPIYMAPEQSSDSRDVDPRADIYSLGLTLYVMLTGHSPRVLDLDLVPAAFRSLIKHATCADRNQRMVSAEQFCAMLDQIERDLKESTQGKGRSQIVVPASGATEAIPEPSGALSMAAPAAKKSVPVPILVAGGAAVALIAIVSAIVLSRGDANRSVRSITRPVEKTPVQIATVKPTPAATARAVNPVPTVTPRVTAQPTATPTPTPTPLATAVPPRSIADGMETLLDPIRNRPLRQAFDDFKNYQTIDPRIRQRLVPDNMAKIQAAMEQAKRSRPSDLPLLHLLSGYAKFRIGLIDDARAEFKAARDANQPLVQPYDLDDRSKVREFFGLDDAAIEQLYGSE